MRKIWTIAFCIVMLILIVEFMPACFAFDATVASNAINQAERDLNNAYANVSQAETAGADVSALLNKLNSAGTYLSKANASFNAGYYSDAFALAANCSDIMKGVADEAAKLKSYAEEVHNNTLFWALFISVFGVLFVAVLGFLGWGFLKKKYSTVLFNKRPRVVDNREL